MILKKTKLIFRNLLTYRAMIIDPKKLRAISQRNIRASISSQSRLFLDGEGDNWFERNKKSISETENFYEIEIIKRVLSSFDSIQNILEIGCGNATKLNNLCSYFNAQGSGIDPSALAIENGIGLFKNLKLSVGTASNIPYKENAFDLVFFGFCLYLIDRDDIFKVISESDRVLKKGGFLVIFDFDPAQRHKTPYHHKFGIFTYKTSYSEFFTNSGHYSLVAKESFSHHENHFSLNSDERISLSILYKEPEPY
jgi:ubiquinone/menaquinone biosynthesis C-methylase UbiE